MRSSVVLGRLLLSTTLLACGQPPEHPVDGGTGRDVGTDSTVERLEVTPPAPPNIPWREEGFPPIALPVFTPCPEGWHEVASEALPDGTSVVTCDPYGAEAGGGVPDVCPEGQAHFLGDVGCTPVGAPCPAGDFPEGLPAGAEILYVLSSASAGGDGRRGSPVPTIGDAMDRASEGTVIAIGKGSYDEAVLVGAGVTLWGACAAETRLTNSRPSASSRAVIIASATDTHVTNLRIGPAEVFGILATGLGTSVSIDGVIIEGARSAGILVTGGARMDGREVTVVNTRGDSAGMFGIGIVVESASEAELTQLLVSQNRDGGVLAQHEGTSITLSDTLIHDSQGRQLDGTSGYGLALVSGATGTITRASIMENRAAGIAASGAGTSMLLSDVVVRGTKGTDNDGTLGVGLTAWEGATIEGARVLLSQNHFFGVSVFGPDAAMTLSDSVVRNTQAQESDGQAGGGMRVLSGASATLRRTLLSGNRDIGLIGHGADASLTLVDLVIRGTEGGENDRQGGSGLVVEASASATVTRALLWSNRMRGIFAGDEGTSLELEDVVIRDTRSQESDGLGGWGLNVERGARVGVSRALLSNNRGVAMAAGEGASVVLSDVIGQDTRGHEADGAGGMGLWVGTGALVELTRAELLRNRMGGILADGDGTSVTLSDVLVADTEGLESDGSRGRGLGAQAGATMHVTRTQLSRNREFGAVATDLGTTMRLVDVTVDQTDETACARTTCPDHPFGVGIVGAEATLTVNRFDLRDSLLCGVLVMADGQVDLSEGEVSGSQIGVCLQADGYSVARLTDRVRFFDNGTNLDTTSLPLPATDGTLVGGP